MKPFKVGDLVRIKDYADLVPHFNTGEFVNINGRLGTIKYADTRRNTYFVSVFSQNCYSSVMDMTKDNMELVSKEEYPELFI